MEVLHKNIHILRLVSDYILTNIYKTCRSASHEARIVARNPLSWTDYASRSREDELPKSPSCHVKIVLHVSVLVTIFSVS